MSECLKKLCCLSVEAGTQALKYYQKSEMGLTRKEDQSPLTLADLASHHTIIEGLKRMTPSVPILSEESEQSESASRLEWSRYWLVDPLDGTKEFIQGRDEFTVNIALIENGVPVIGVVHVPTQKVTYFGEKSQGAFKEKDNSEPKKIKTRPMNKEKVVGAISRSHTNEELKVYENDFQQIDSIQMGSSLKFCLIAEGIADFYLRKKPTMEWDTAAADRILQEAGGGIRNENGTPLQYNKRELINPSFIAFGDAKFPWKKAFT